MREAVRRSPRSACRSAMSPMKMIVPRSLQALGHPKPDIGGAGDDPRFGMRDEQRRQLVRACAARTSPARTGGRDRAQQRRDLAVVGGPRRVGLAGVEDRAVAGAAAQIAGDDVLDRRALGPERADAARRRATSRSPACRSRIASRGRRPSPAGPGGARRPATGSRRSSAPCRRASAGRGCRR